MALVKSSHEALFEKILNSLFQSKFITRMLEIPSLRTDDIIHNFKVL